MLSLLSTLDRLDARQCAGLAALLDQIATLAHQEAARKADAEAQAARLAERRRAWRAERSTNRQRKEARDRLAVRLYCQGVPLAKIAAQIGVSPRTVQRIVRNAPRA